MRSRVEGNAAQRYRLLHCFAIQPSVGSSLSRVTIVRDQLNSLPFCVSDWASGDKEREAGRQARNPDMLNALRLIVHPSALTSDEDGISLVQRVVKAKDNALSSLSSRG